MLPKKWDEFKNTPRNKMVRREKGWLKDKREKTKNLRERQILR